MAELRKIKASTIIESIVAMVIITLVLGVALSVLSFVSGRNNPQIRFKAFAEAQRALNNCQNKAGLVDQEWNSEGLRIEKTVGQYREYPGIRLIEIKVYNNSGRLMIQRKELIQAPE